MPTGVVGDHTPTGALQQARAHNDVASCRRQPMQQNERRTCSALLAGQLDLIVCADAQLLQGTGIIACLHGIANWFLAPAGLLAGAGLKETV